MISKKWRSLALRFVSRIDFNLLLLPQAKRNVTPGALRQIVLNCSSLREIGLNDVSPVDDSVLETIGKNHRLEKIDLGSCYRITDKGLSYVFSTSASRLTSISLRFCASVTSQGVIALIQKCRGIRVLDLRGLTLLDDSVFPEFKKLPLLTSLDLSYCSKCTEFKELAFGCGDLRSLNLRVTKISDKDALLIMKHSPFLRDFNLWGCENVAQSTLNLARRLSEQTL